LRYVRHMAEPRSHVPLKDRYRGAILEAATAMLAEQDGPRLHVDTLADRAGVSRRSVFNHFASLDDVVLTVACERVEQQIDEAYRRRTPARPDDLLAAFDELTEVLRALDLPGTIASLHPVLGRPGTSPDPQQRQLTARTFDRVTDGLTSRLTVRYPALDLLSVELASTMLVHTIGVVARHWAVRTDRTSPAARAEWDRLLAHLLDQERAALGGHGPEPVAAGAGGAPRTAGAPAR
jgi:TetR/AcrR family transcriptional regulator, regulator of autoinduction and epiphytic fitness